MKKLFFLGALFAVGLGFTACSSSDDVTNEANSTGEVGGNNYIAISINMPSAPSGMTRADDNGEQVTFSDGLTTEYEVKDAVLLVFGKSDETFKQAFNLSASDFTTAGTDKQVTSHGTKIIQMVGSSVVAGDLALVVLNNNGLFTLSGNDIKFGEDKFTGTFTQFSQKLAQTSGLDASSMMGSGKGFFMANAPLANKPGSSTTEPTGATLQVLTPITTIFKTYEEANNGTADQIYVERGMAKVTMTKAITTANMQNSKLSDNTELEATIDGWTLDNCNKKSYLVRSIDGHAGFISLHSLATGGVYRYIGNAPITYPAQPANPYRNYFAKSVNYEGTSELNTVTGVIDFKTTFGEENPQYCFENTFPVIKQTIKNTTLVQLQVTAKPSGGSAQDLFTAGGNKTVIYNETGIKGLIQEAVYDYIVANDLVASGTFDSKDIGVTLDTYDETAKLTNVVLTYSASNGTATLKGAAFTSGNDGTSGTFTQTVKDEVKKKGEIYKYTGGVSYYNIRIKHFGDILTPWNNGEYASGYAPQNYTSSDATAAAKIAKIYPDGTDSRQDNNYLGRYGVLRNNWYNLKVNKINYLGDPTPHTGAWPDTPDDEMVNYISFQINILSWAKREQSADL